MNRLARERLPGSRASCSGGWDCETLNVGSCAVNQVVRVELSKRRGVIVRQGRNAEPYSR